MLFRAAQCEVYRQACDQLDPGLLTACLAARDVCKLTVDLVVAGQRTPPAGCMPATGVQPCEWASEPELLGQAMYAIPANPVDDEFPYACSPGFLGSALLEDQTGPLCAGYWCGRAAIRCSRLEIPLCCSLSRPSRRSHAPLQPCRMVLTTLPFCRLVRSPAGFTCPT